MGYHFTHRDSIARPDAFHDISALLVEALAWRWLRQPVDRVIDQNLDGRGR